MKNEAGEQEDKTLEGATRSAELERQISKVLSRIRYGSVEISIHDGKVVQLEVKEKIRFER